MWGRSNFCSGDLERLRFVTKRDCSHFSFVIFPFAALPMTPWPVLSVDLPEVEISFPAPLG